MKLANSWNLRDMCGNVYEWCWDWHSSEYYGESPLQDPLGPTSGEYRVIRGGSFSLLAMWVRSASRFWYRPGSHRFHIGFRLVRSL